MGERAREIESERARERGRDKMGIGATLLKITSALSLIVSTALVGVSGYVYRHRNPHIGQIALARITVQAALGFGLLTFILSIVGYVGATKKNKCVLLFFFTFLQTALAGLVAISAAL